MPLSANSDSSQLPHQVDDALTSIRAIRAQHRAEVIAKGEILRLVPDELQRRRENNIRDTADRIGVAFAEAGYPWPTDEFLRKHALRIVDANESTTREPRKVARGVR